MCFFQQQNVSHRDWLTVKCIYSRIVLTQDYRMRLSTIQFNVMVSVLPFLHVCFSDSPNWRMKPANNNKQISHSSTPSIIHFSLFACCCFLFICLFVYLFGSHAVFLLFKIYRYQKIKCPFHCDRIARYKRNRNSENALFCSVQRTRTH